MLKYVKLITINVWLSMLCIYVFQHLWLSVLCISAFWDFSHSYKEERHLDWHVVIYIVVITTP